MTTQHTPGPWFVWPNNNGRLQVGQSTNYTVAEMMQTPIHGQEANSRLIAAAPDLLEALKVILRDHMAVHGVGDLEMQPALFQVRAAIAKATGEK